MLLFFKYRTIWIVIGLLITAIGIASLLEPGVRDPYNRTVGLHRMVAVATVKAGIANFGVCICSADAEARLVGEYGLSTAISVYGRTGSEPRPGIVLIHGNTALGRKLPTYKVMATKLAERGFIVLTLDLPGFGESDDPFALGTPEALDETRMIEAAIRHFITNTNVDRDNISIIGHSRGRGPALKVAVAKDEIRSIILMGVSSGWITDESPEGPDRRALETYSFVYRQPMPEWVTADVWREHMVHADIGEYGQYFGRARHKPIMLVVGERERERTADMVLGKDPSALTERIYDYLRQTYANLTEPKKFVVLKGSDHYNNTAQSLGVIFYDRAVAAQLANEIAAWVVAPAGPDSKILKPAGGH